MNALVEQREKLPAALKPAIHQMDMAIWAWLQLGDEHRENARTACTAVLSKLTGNEETAWVARTAHGRLQMLHDKHPNQTNVTAFAKWLEVEERTRTSLWWRFWYS